MPEARAYDLPEHVTCPFCDQGNTELHSPFGTALSVATYWCLGCRTAFEWVKWGEHASPGAVGDDADPRRAS